MKKERREQIENAEIYEERIEDESFLSLMSVKTFFRDKDLEICSFHNSLTNKKLEEELKKQKISFVCSVCDGYNVNCPFYDPLKY